MISKSNTMLFKIVAAFFVTAFLFLYFNVFVFLSRAWIGRDDYLHGFLVPFISFYMVWIKRHRLAKIELDPSYKSGSIVVMLGSLILLAGGMGSIVALGQISLLVMLPGIVLLLFGAGFLKACLLPLAYLVLMVPTIIDPILEPLHWPSQLFSASIAGFVLQHLGIPVFQHSQFLELPWLVLEVENECSGIRYLVSILSIGIPLAILAKNNVRDRIVVIVLALVVGLVANPIRVTLIGIWANFGGEILHGPAHILQGFFVSVMGFAALFIGLEFIGRQPKIYKKSIEESPDKGIERNSALQNKSKLSVDSAWQPSIKALLVLGVIFFCLWGMIVVRKPAQYQMNQPLLNFPYELSAWRGSDLELKDRPFKLSNIDEEILRAYRSVSGERVRLYFGYYASQDNDKKLVYHKLQSLYDSTREVSFPINNEKSITVNYGSIRNEDTLYEVLYWYEIGGRVISSRYIAKLFTIMMNLTERRSDGGFVAVFRPMAGSDRKNHPPAVMIEFAKALLPVTEKWFSNM
jgi:EpsI family protein